MQDNVIQSIADLFSFQRILATLAVLFVASIVVKAVYFLSQALSSRFSRYRLQISGVFPIARLIIWVGAFFFIIIVVYQPPENTILAIVASAGVALGLGAQDILKNLLAGVLLIFNQPFRVGDMVQIGPHYGEVVRIDLYSIRLRTFEDSTVTIPNSFLLNQTASNSNSGNLDEMISIEFCLPATVDVQRIKSLAWEATVSSPYTYLKKPIVITVEDHFDRTFLTRFNVKAYVLDVRLERLFASDILERIKKALIEKEILSEHVVLGLLSPQRGR